MATEDFFYEEAFVQILELRGQSYGQEQKKHSDKGTPVQNPQWVEERAKLWLNGWAKRI